MEKIAVIGAGLIGSLQAIYLAKKGYQVEVYEKRPDSRKSTAEGGRSINLALSDRGFKALQKVGLEEEIRNMAIPMDGRYIHNADGSETFQPYGKEGQSIYSISRAGLNRKLMNTAEPFDNVDYFFDLACHDIDMDENEVHFKNTNTEEIIKKKFDRIFGTDGAFSAVRHRLQFTDRFNYSQTYLEHGYKELSIPDEGGSFKLPKNGLHIWPRKSFMLIALPNLDGSFTVTLFLAFEGEHSFENLKTRDQVEEFFKKHFADAIELMPDYLDQFFDNPTSSLVMIKCSPWNYKDQVLLMGDASHAIVPFYGQGMNSGFEDCSVFEEVYHQENNWLDRFARFSKERKPDCDAICDLALQNFIEMRDLVADPEFLLRKEIEKHLHQKFPDKWVPLYSMVTFSDIPYSKAMNLGIKQRKIMDDIMKIDNIDEKWKSPEIENKILSAL